METMEGVRRTVLTPLVVLSAAVMVDTLSILTKEHVVVNSNFNIQLFQVYRECYDYMHYTDYRMMYGPHDTSHIQL